MSDLVVGGRVVDREAARQHARHYLTDGSGWAYPSYDGYERECATGPLTDADFLAPMLLNVNHLKIATYEALQARRDELDHVLQVLPTDLDLKDADEATLGLIGQAFAVLDDGGVRGAQGTVLAKVLHRKRPRLIPLYDEQVRSVYQDGIGAPVSSQRGRSWCEFVVLFAAAVQVDLRREGELWDEIASWAPGPSITPLRSLDIVAWWAGRER